ncbi:MAG: urease accessory protein UreD [Janthinobacterium lividum]
MTHRLSPAREVAPTGGASRHQRVDGAARIVFAVRGQRTALADLYQRAPCRVLFPDVDPGEPLQVVLLTTSGGLTGGDRIAVSVAVGAGATATVTTQAAEKLYRALPLDEATRIETRLTIGAGGCAEWLGQEAILFDASRVRRTFEAELAADARLLAVESLVFGRTAMGERFASGHVHDSWRIRRAGRLIWADALRLDGSGQAALPFGFGDALATATIVYAGADAGEHIGEARRLVGGDRGGATSFDGLLIVRLIAADAAALRRGVVRIAAGLRAAILNLTPRLPAVWTC